MTRRGQFERDGYVTLPGFFGPDAIAAFRRSLDAASPRDRSPHRLDRDGMRFSSNLFRSSGDVAEFVTQRRIAGLLRALVGRDLWVRWDQRVIKGPGGPAFPWHQDNAYNHLPFAHVQLWVALTDMDDAHGGLWVDPGSHRRGRRRHRRQGNQVVARHGPHQPVSIAADAGDVVVFSSLLLHHTTPNTTTAVRDAYVVEYLARACDDPLVDAPYLLLNDGGPTAAWAGRGVIRPPWHRRIRTAPLLARRMVRRLVSGMR